MLFKKSNNQNYDNEKVKLDICNKIENDINKTKFEFNVRDIDFKKELDNYIEENFKFNDNYFKISADKVYKKYDFNNFKLNKISVVEYLKFLESNKLISKNKADLYKSNNLNKREIIIDFEKYIEDLVNNEIFLEYFKLFDSIRKKMIDELVKKMKMIEEMTNKLKSFSNIFGRFWDLSEHDLYKMDDSFLKKLESLLNEKSFIQKIAELLGRLADSQNKYEEHLIKETMLTPSNKKSFYSPENIVSVKFGNDLSSILKYQLLLRSKKETKQIFDVNFIESKLLQFDQSAKIIDEKEIFRKERRLKKDSKGPFILCIDTSGSMHGEPETIAKAISLSIFKIAKRENRKCYIINFSTRIVEFDASDVNRSFNKFYDFLIMSFSGGTDVEPALKRACEKCVENNYKNSDVLIISDFIINQINNDLLLKINKLKKNKVRFNALSIGCSQIKEHMTCFDNNWVYDGSQESIDKIIRDLNNIEKNDEIKHEENK